VANATNGNSDEQRHGPSTNSSAHDKSSATIPDAERTPGQQHLDEVGQKGRDMFKTGEKVMTEGAKEGAIILATDGLGRIATKAAGPLATNVGRLWDKVVKFFRGERQAAGAADAALAAKIATAPVEKFSDYIFKEGATHGKDKVFRSLGYDAAHSAELANVWEKQAAEKFAKGEYSLGKLDAYGQRININIQLSGIGAAADKTSNINSGWMMLKNGEIKLNTPFSGFTK
jgi:hypothetical protein